MRLLLTALIAISGLSEGIALPLAIHDGVAMRRAFAKFRRRPGGEPGTTASVLKGRESFLVELDVRELADVVAEMVPKSRAWLTWVAAGGIAAGTAAAMLAAWQ